MVGALPLEAKHKVFAMHGRAQTTFMEVYGGGAIDGCANQSRRDFGLKGIGALDIRTQQLHGGPCDFTVRSDRRLGRELIDIEYPDWVVGSPPCTPFSMRNVGAIFPIMD